MGAPAVNRRAAAALVTALVAAPAAGAEIRYLAFGDSITRGNNCPAQGPQPTKIFDELGPGCDRPCADQEGADRCAYAWRLEEALGAAGVDAQVVNEGFGGETTAEGVTRIDSLLDDGYDVLLLMEGTNDIFQGINPEVVRDNLGVLDDKATAQGVDTVHGTIIHTLVAKNEPPTADLRSDVIALAAARDRYLADHWQFLCPDQPCFDEHYSEVGANVGHVDSSGYEVMTAVWSAALTGVAPPGAATPVAPSGDIADDTPAFVWNRVDAANWYHLAVDSASENLVDLWLQEADVCAGATCTATPGGTLMPGDYTWRVRTRNPHDLGPWSPPMDFKILGPSGLVMPAGLTVDMPALESDGNGVFEPGETVRAVPSWHNGGDETVSADGSVIDFSGPAGASYTVVVGGVDYTLPAGTTASCQDSGNGCYELALQLPGGDRPRLHWDATVGERIKIAADETRTHAWTLHVGSSFADVPSTGAFYAAIETLLHHGITDGCAGSNVYCPREVTSRAQIAVFLIRAVEGADYVPPACVGETRAFADVPATSPFCRWIEELARHDVISGCGGDRYCPTSPVTRAQVAVMLLKALEGGDYAPPQCTGTFEDVPCTSLFADWIEELFERQVTRGCATDPPAYCPQARLTRAQTAAFLAETFALTLYGS